MCLILGGSSEQKAEKQAVKEYAEYKMHEDDPKVEEPQMPEEVGILGLRYWQF